MKILDDCLHSLPTPHMGLNRVATIVFMLGA